VLIPRPSCGTRAFLTMPLAQRACFVYTPSKSHLSRGMGSCSHQRNLDLRTAVPCMQARQRGMSEKGYKASALPTLGVHLNWCDTPDDSKGEGDYARRSTSPASCGDGPLVLPPWWLRAGDSLACPCSHRARLGRDRCLWLPATARSPR